MIFLHSIRNSSKHTWRSKKDIFQKPSFPASSCEYPLGAKKTIPWDLSPHSWPERPTSFGFLFGVHVYGTSQVLPCGRNVFLWSSTKAITPKSSTTSTKSDKQLCYVICSIGSLGDFQAACCWVNDGYVVCCNSIGYRLYTRVVSCCSVWVKTKKDMYFFDSISKDSALL